MRLVLVRHGLTGWNIEGRIQGRTDTSLAPRGLEQAGKIAEMISREKPSRIFSSTLSRALKTSELIGEKFGLAVEKRDELVEINYGIFEGKTFAELGSGDGLSRAWAERKKDKYRFKPQNGESFQEMNEDRIQPFVHELLHKFEDKTAIVVAHSGTNRLIAGNCLGLPPEKMVDIWQPNEVVYFLECRFGHCDYSHQAIGWKKPKIGYLTVNDAKAWGARNSP
ncbi:MAG: histidine phosphatase family protein [Candidatus Diapherotrites archaeon]|nr:histidine phosphatase family protein [Candidatus Diapherotrites archaeon]